MPGMNRSAAVLTVCITVFAAACATPAGEAGTSPPVTQQQVLPEYTGPDYLYPVFNELRQEGPVIPGMGEQLVPQGMAYWQQEDLMIISHYADDKTAGALTFVRMEEGKLEKTLYLNDSGSTPHTGHLGGLAVSAEHLWIASGAGVYPLTLSSLLEYPDGERVVLPQQIGTETKGSFASYHDGVLWVGEFTRADGSYPVPGTHQIGRGG